MMSDEEQRRIDDDYNVVNHYYRAKMMHPNIPLWLDGGAGHRRIRPLEAESGVAFSANIVLLPLQKVWDVFKC